jgi:hypothetical protein
MLLLAGSIRPAAARRRLVMALASAAVISAGAPAAAESLPDAEVSRRLAFIEARLSRATPTANLWWHAWYFGYMVVTVGQAGVALSTTSQGLRTDTAVGAAFATLGVVGLGIFDFPPRHAAATLRAVAGITPAERRRKLARAEALLAASARAEVVGHSWIPHVVGVVVTGTSSLVQAFAYKRVASSIVTLLSGVAITEAQIFTRPTAAIDDWHAYRQGAWADGAAAAVPRGPAFRLAPHSGGAGIAVAF